jgi:hypothetical protein
MFKELHTSLFEAVEKELEQSVTRLGGVGHEREFLYTKSLLCRIELLTSFIDDDPMEVYGSFDRFKKIASQIGQVKYHLGFYLGNYKRAPEFYQVYQVYKEHPFENVINHLDMVRVLREHDEADEVTVISHLRDIVSIVSALVHKDMGQFGPALDASFSLIYNAFQPTPDYGGRAGNSRPREPSEKDTALFLNNRKFRDQVNLQLLQLMLLYPDDERGNEQA